MAELLNWTRFFLQGAEWQYAIDNTNLSEYIRPLSAAPALTWVIILLVMLYVILTRRIIITIVAEYVNKLTCLYEVSM